MEGNRDKNRQIGWTDTPPTLLRKKETLVRILFNGSPFKKYTHMCLGHNDPTNPKPHGCQNELYECPQAAPKEPWAQSGLLE